MFPFFARLTTCLINGSASCSSNCSANNVAWFRLPEGRPEMTSFICTILDLRPECVLVNPAGEKLGSNGSPCPSNPSTPIKAVPADGDNSSMEPAHNSRTIQKRHERQPRTPLPVGSRCTEEPLDHLFGSRIGSTT